MIKEYTDNGIMYTYEIVSSEGGDYLLYPEPKHTKEDKDKAKYWLRQNFDVVSLKLAREDDRDYLYKSEVFAHPLVKKLRWFQVNDNPTLLRAERKKGTSPEDFVKLYVLPYTKKMEEYNLEISGVKIYNF